MWKPADDLEWQRDASCANPKNKKSVDWFFSKDPQEKYAAKNMCFE